ncbi:MAG: ABC transporter permease [Pseudomonadota bacterium]
MTGRARAERLRSYPGFGSLALLCLVFLYAPLLVVAVYSFNAARSITNWGGFSLDWYVQAFNNPTIRDAAGNSLFVAVIAATLATTLATMAAISLLRGPAMRIQTGAVSLVSLPLLVPEIITAVASLIFFITIGIPLGFVSLIAAHTVFCIPFAYLPISARLNGIAAELDEAASDLYASRGDMIRTILLPLMAPGIASGFCLAFIVSLDDFIIASFVSGPGATTLPVAIYGLARIGFTPEINAVATLMLAISILFVGLSWLLSRKTTQPD